MLTSVRIGFSVIWSIPAISARAAAGVMWESTTSTSSSVTTTIELLRVTMAPVPETK